MEYGEKIAVLRKEHGMTQAELGDELNVTYQAVSKWERGESYPNFDTMSRIAKLFGVPLSYFEDNDDESQSEDPDEDSANPDSESPALLGMCVTCGKTVYSGDEASTAPKLICKACMAREAELKKIRAKQEQEERDRKAKAEQERIRQIHFAAKRKFKKGMIVAAVVSGAWLLLSLIVAVSEKDMSIFGGNVLFSVILFTFIAQMIWGGVVRDVCCKGGVIIGTPGVIFSLSLDGVIFLIAVKILLAVLRMLVYIIFLLFFVIIAFIISPFTFIPVCISLAKGQSY